MRSSIAIAGVAAVLVVTTAGAAQAVHRGRTGSVTRPAQRLVLDKHHRYGNRYRDGVLPVGDGKYKDDVAKKGYYDACPQYVQALSAGGGGAQVRGPWFVHHDKDYALAKKVNVHGKVHWDATHRVAVKHGKRVITTNDLPTHTTGRFPIRSTDPAYSYDRNPNHIAAQNVTLRLPAKPKYGAPHCGGGMVGYMTTGVLLFNGFDAGGRDAGAWEVQDRCDGHPDEQSTYHYHTLSRCIRNQKVTHVIGWALDGFPITGPYLSKHNVLTTRDLDVCHGITSQIRVNGKAVRTYHYVMTQDFPYSVSCFRASPVTTGPL